VGPLALRLGVISGETVILNTDLFWYSFHIWRPFTALFVYGLGFPYLTKLYFLYNYSTRLEKDHFAGKPADMAYMMLVIFMTTSKCQKIGSKLAKEREDSHHNL